MSNKKKIVVSVTNDISTDQRVDKVCNYLYSRGWDVVLLGRKLPTSSNVNRKYKVVRFKLWFNKGAFFYLTFNIRLFFYLLFNKSDVYLSNDIDTLPANYFASKFTKRPIVFDAHEAFSEVPELINRKFKKSVWRWVEKKMIPKTKIAYTVSNGVAEFYKKLTGKSMQVIYNYPLLKSETEKSNISFRQDKKNIIYQGAVNKGRGIDGAIEAMQYIDAVLHIIGIGDEYIKMKELTEKLKLTDKVVFYGRVLPDELKSLTPQADLGISFEEDIGLNYRYSLPNKLFDYILAGVPVMVSDLPEMKRVVLESKVGEVLNSRKPEEVAMQIINLLSNDGKLKECKENCKSASQKYCWEQQEPLLDKIFSI